MDKKNVFLKIRGCDIALIVLLQVQYLSYFLFFNVNCTKTDKDCAGLCICAPKKKSRQLY